MPRISGMIGALMLGVACSACATGDQGTARFTTVDSAGISIAYSQAPRWGQIVVTERAFEFGDVSGPEHLLFDRIRGVSRLGDSTLVVGNQGTNTLRVFDEAGRLLDEFGGSGKGPGEFTLLRGVFRCEPGIITTFEYNWRQLRFDLQGRFLESQMVSFPGDRFGVYSLSCGRQGQIVGTGWGDSGTLDHPLGMYRSQGGIYTAETAFGPFDQIGTTAVDDRVRWADGEGPHPFGRTTVLAALEDDFVLGTADNYSYAVHTSSGDTVRVVRWTGPARPLSDRRTSEYLAWRLADAPEEMQPAIRREVAEYEMPDSLPAYGDIKVSPDGIVWVREFSTQWRRSSKWWGFLPSGEWGWELLLEPDFEVTEFGVNEVLGVATDGNGIERVRGYRLGLPRDSR